MTRKLKFLVAASTLSAVIMNASSAYAAGTQAGIDISNTVQVNYNVGTVSQTAVPSNTDTFKVDRKIIFTVQEAPTTLSTIVAPGQTDAVVTYIVANTSNDTLDFSLTAANITGAAPRGSDTIDASNLEMCIDANDNGSCDGAETWVSAGTIDNLAADSDLLVFVRGDFAANVADGAIAGVRLTATALDSSGNALTNDSGSANLAGTVQNVFADVVGTNDNTAAYDGIVSTLDDYTVDAAVLSVFKTSRVVSDPVSTSNPKAIPGAVVEYCISVANASGGATATNISIADVIPANTTFQTGSILLNAAVATPGLTQTCSGGTAGGTYNSGTSTVQGTLSDITGGNALALIFRVTIN